MSWLYSLYALVHPRIAILGFREGDGDVGMTYDDDPDSPKSVAYDTGRAIRRKLLNME